MQCRYTYAQSFTRLLGAGMAVLMLSACASQSAQEVALSSLKALADYEKQVDAKIAAEKKFYRGQAKVMQDALAGVPVTAEANAPVSDEDIQKTWVYLQIRTSATADARKTAGDILALDRARAISLMTAFVMNGIREDYAAIIEARAAQARLMKQFVAELNPVEKQRQRLAALRKGLTTLATAPDDAASLAQAQAIGAVLLEEIKKPGN